MIAIGGTIGTGLFVGTGQTLSIGGPAFILIAFLILTFFVVCVVTAITEIAAYLPVHGGTMSYYGYRFVSPSLGFSMGWLYFYSLGILVPFEITAASIVIGYWPNSVPIAVWITIMIVVIVGLNVLPVKVYGETEFWFASIKIICLVGLLILGVVLFFGGGPDTGVLGFHYWKHPGAANTYLLEGSRGYTTSFFYTIVLAAFPFAFSPEMLVVTGGEMESPRRNLPKAAKRYFYRLITFYVGGVFIIGVTVASNTPALTNGGAGAGSSPFVIGIKNAGIGTLDSIVNAVIIISAWSSGNAFLYLSSRSLYSLAISGNAPHIFKACSKRGVPYNAVAASSLFCALAYLNVASSSSVVFNWFVNLTNTSAFISWMCCCIIYLRFRKACRAHGIIHPRGCKERRASVSTDPDRIPWTSPLQPWGAYCALVFFAILMLINGFTVFLPSQWSVKSFLTAYIGIPAFLVLYLGHRAYRWTDRWSWRPEDVDMFTGMDEVIAAEAPAPVYEKWWQKVLHAVE
jgi:amino acid transporter